jgi:citrate/tricarballylate utilization protein
VPRTLAAIRLRSYEEYCWPRALGGMFRQHSIGTALALAVAFSVVMFAAAWLNGSRLLEPVAGADFYAVVPHGVMVALFGAVGLFVAIAIAIGVGGFWRDTQREARSKAGAADLLRGLRDALTLRHLHTTGPDCTSNEEERSPWRRYCHHATFYGFVLCFASTTVAAIYHSVFGWHAPYAYTSLPVVLGSAGGLGLVAGPLGLFALRRKRDPALTAAGYAGLDESFIVLLLLTSVTGMALLVLRDGALMGALLLVHLGFVLALFVTLPYGKFVHGLYRVAALVKYSAEKIKN